MTSTGVIAAGNEHAGELSADIGRVDGEEVESLEAVAQHGGVGEWVEVGLFSVVRLLPNLKAIQNEIPRCKRPASRSSHHELRRTMVD